MFQLRSLALTSHGSLEDRKSLDWETITHFSTKMKEWAQRRATQWVLGCLLDDWTGVYIFERLRFLEELEPSPSPIQIFIRFVASYPL